MALPRIALGLSLTVACALQAAVAFAAEYTCPAEIHASSAKAAEAQGFSLWNDPQAKTQLEGIALYDGPPSEMADLKPDNGDDANAKHSIWTLSESPRGYWMVCRYANTDQRFIKQIETPKKSCHTKNDDSVASQLICE